MNWAWTTSFDQLWRSPTFPMWLTLAAAGFFGIILLITLLRAEKSVANGALTVITLLAIGIAVAATMRTFGPGDRAGSGEARSLQQTSAVLPALSCIDDLAGETVYFTASNVARPAATGTYEVIRLLPTDGDDCQYRIKSSTEAFERVAKESQLDIS